MAESLRVEAVAFAPPEWTCCGFPLEAEGAEVISLDSAMRTLHRLADTVTEWDSTALGPAMHVAHMLVRRIGSDGRWPARLNARTGEAIGDERTDSPMALYRRLKAMLDTTEYDHLLPRYGTATPHQ